MRDVDEDERPRVTEQLLRDFQCYPVFLDEVSARAPRSAGPPAGRPTRPAAVRSHRVLVLGKRHAGVPSVAPRLTREQTV